MLMTAPFDDERVTTAQRAKLAYIYVRQSSVSQVRQHQESTELQYRLVDRAVALGSRRSASTSLTRIWESRARAGPNGMGSRS